MIRLPSNVWLSNFVVRYFRAGKIDFSVALAYKKNWENKMKFNTKKLERVRSASGMALALLACSNLALAGNYQSSVALPVIHSKGYLHTAELPVSRHAPAAAAIKNVSWNWNVAGWPQRLEVHLCQGDSLCLNVSRQRTGSTAFFDNQLASRKFYYTMKIGNAGRVPVAGQQGRITVDW
ncbi:hypothetical protein ALQ71_05338 [Pseudomonas coronafaciens pv. striafaciens]|nr:hypothetical protein ALQ71_05338 [Pseudomonas coronafaciens pv. striafaciens]